MPRPSFKDCAQALDWPSLAADLEQDPGAPLLVALSGGADSVYLLDVLRRAQGSPKLLAVHVNHGLRGSESAADEQFCSALCERWEIPLEVVHVTLDADASNLEERARNQRYRALGELALDHGIAAVATAHHRGDLLETLLMRWMRGAAPAGLVGPARCARYPLALANAPRLALLRPLLEHDADQIRASLTGRGLTWREDTSNRSSRFTRNRIRHGLLPLLRATCGEHVIDDLAAFQQALAQHERNLARVPFELPWQAAARGRRQALRCPRLALDGVPRPLLERGLYHSILEHTARAPRRQVLHALGQALATDDTGHWNLRAGWGLELARRTLWLLHPAPVGDFRGAKR